MVIYTATQGRPLAPNKDLGCQMVCISPTRPTKPWRWIKLPMPFDRPVMNAKAPKILPWEFFDFDECWWIDANIEMISLPHVTADLALHRHPKRDCIFDEAKACINKGKDTEERINRTTNRYADHPQHAGLWECNVIYRKNTEQNKQLCLDWWDAIQLGTHRDQISFPVMLKQHDIIPQALNHDARHSSHFKVHRRL